MGCSRSGAGQDCVACPFRTHAVLDDNFYEAEIMSPSVTFAADNIDGNRSVAIFPDSENRALPHKCMDGESRHRIEISEE